MAEIDKARLVSDTKALDDFNRNVVEEFRANGGKVGGPFEGGALLLLHTTGAKSGQPRLSPLAYLEIDGKMMIIGSYAGAPKDPAWVHNLRADPNVQIRDLTVVQGMRVREVTDATERARLWQLAVAAFPPYAEYQTKTDRLIPVFVLTPLHP